MRRKDKFVEGEIYHVFNKSISNYGIFKDLWTLLNISNDGFIRTTEEEHKKVGKYCNPKFLDLVAGLQIFFLSFSMFILSAIILLFYTQFL